ncbi:MAG: 4Fe-4S dicluster domain-containing protein [Candidatus Saccharibacteria bacterium]
MAHRTAKTGYAQLLERLNRFPQGAPPSETLFQILNLLFTEKEAEMVALLPIKPFTVELASRIWKTDLRTAQNQLETLAGRGLLLDVDDRGTQRYVLPPPMAGFFEFAMMRTRGDIDQKLLSELYYQYITVEEDFIKDLFQHGETKVGRVFVQEAVLSGENAVHVLDYERASSVIQNASHMGISLCYCRHKMSHLDRACSAPMDNCMTFSNTARSLAANGLARLVDKSEGMELLAQAYENNLVQFGENVRETVSFICNCCGCCCEAMIAARRHGFLHPIHTTNFLPQVNQNTCTGCGRCVNACPVEAMTLVSANNPRNARKMKAQVIEDICLGCGVCVRACLQSDIVLISRKERVITPVNSVHRIVIMAIERGTLHHLIFDNQAFASHRAMAAILSAILGLPPLKQALASKQMKSRYLDSLIGWYGRRAE